MDEQIKFGGYNFFKQYHKNIDTFHWPIIYSDIWFKITLINNVLDS